ncbi:MAG TPA: amidohydrolase family protein [Tepidisphaeraceae bacterium]|nr:amidohydrolase family protein [Tepidisphaeraceae bacterium]
MSHAQTILGPILNPRVDGTVEFTPDGGLSCNDAGTIEYAGPAAALPPSLASSRPKRQSDGFILPPFLDAHIHIPQHPIRGHFMDGIARDPPEGRLLAGLNRNVFPEEARCESLEVVERVVRDFARDTLAQGVVGGAAYMTVHEAATEVALSQLHAFWSVGLVLMEMNCPQYLRTDPAQAEAQMRRLAERFGRRFMVTDRFAVTVGSDLRRRAARLAWDLDLMTQTHLNEQLREKQLVEQTLYPRYDSYADVYRQDGLLDGPSVLAHCVHMTPPEYEILARRNAFVAHCPTSNALLCSGIMPLDEILAHEIEYAICTDVGASPTTSILAEMAQFLKIHAGRSPHATPSEALYRSTLAPALKLGVQIGSLAVGRPLSFIEVEPFTTSATSAEDAILRGVLGLSAGDLNSPALKRALDRLQAVRLDCGPDLDVLQRDVRDTANRLENRVVRVTLAGEVVYNRPTPPAGPSPP